MDGAAVHRRRPRPVADAPPCDPVAVAKGWLLALVADAPLHQAASVPAADLARGGPALCGAVLAALRSDEHLDRLLGGDGRAPLAGTAGRLAGARTPAATATAVDALCAVVWHALQTELRDPPAALVADLAARLTHVCARITEASLTAPNVEPPGRSGPLADVLAAASAVEMEHAAPEPPPAPPDGVQVVSMPSDPSPEVTAPYVVPADGPAGDPEHREGATVEAPSPEPPAGATPVEAGTGRWRDADADAAAAAYAGIVPPPGAVPVPGPATATITRLHPGSEPWTAADPEAPPWLAAIGRRLERRSRDGRPFAVLVVEVDDLDRLLASQTGREVALALEVAERGMTAELAPADLIVRERLGRWWLTSPDCDGPAARELGTRVGTAISRAVLGGAPLWASIGVAVCPGDGEDVDALAGRADQGMFAARASGAQLG